MNELKIIQAKKYVSLACCNEDKKCESCKPLWQRQLVVDNDHDVWFPLVGINNDVLRALLDEECGLVVNPENGVWLIDEHKALSIASDAEKTIIEELCKAIRGDMVKE